MKHKELLYISVCIFMTLIAWVVGELYHSASKKTVDTVIADPVLLQYKIDTEVIELIKNKQ